jgi:hypothetical protein
MEVDVEDGQTKTKCESRRRMMMSQKSSFEAGLSEQLRGAQLS